MKKHHWNGSLITTTRQSPSSSAANGVFNLVSQQVFKSASKWPATVDLPYVTSGLNLYLDAGDSSSYVNYSTSGTTWSDVTDNSNDATLTNMATTAHTSSNGGYFTFDGTNDYVNGVNSSTTNVTGSITVECLFRVSTGQNNWVRIFGKGDSTNRTYGLWYKTSANQFLWQRYASGVFMSLTYTGSSFALDTWNYLVGVSDGTTHTLYLNNQQLATTTNSTSTYYSSTAAYTVGYGTMENGYHNGDVSMVRLYNRALTSTERTTNYNNEKGRWDGSIVTTDLILHLDAGDLDSYSGSGTTWTDLTDNSNDATLVNGIGYNGANQGSLVFDGSNDYVREDTVLDTFTSTSDTWSIECWFNTDVNPNVVECMIGVNYNNGAENTLLLGVVNNSGCKLAVYYRHSILSDTTAVTVGQWHHVVVTHASGSLKVYLDGIQITSSSNTVNRALSDCAFLIGAELDSGSSFGNYFDGKISATLLYSKALTASETLQNYNALKNRYGHKSVVTDGLALHLDAAHPDSYSGSGTTWSDLTSNDLDFALTNGPVYSSNVGYFTFDGSNDKAEISSGWTSFDSDPFTIEIWYRYHTAAEYEAILGTQGGGTASFQIDFSSTGRLRFRVDGQSNIDSSSSTEGANTWKQVVLVREGTGTNQFKIYLNGSLDTTTTQSTNFNNDSQLRIACNRGNNAFFDGDISVIRIYKNKALTSDEVTQNYDAVKGRYGLS